MSYVGESESHCVIDTDLCGVESIKLVYMLFTFESYLGLIYGRRSSSRLPLPSVGIMDNFTNSLKFKSSPFIPS